MKKINTKQIAVIAILIAMEVVLSRFLSINLWNLKIGFSFVPVMIAANFFGPLGGAIVYGVSDLIGALLFPSGPFFPGFTVSAVLTGIIFGIFLKGKCNAWKILGAVLSSQIICSLLLNTLWISYLYGADYKTLLITRLAQAAVMSVVQIVFAEIVFEQVKLSERIKLK